MKRNSTNALMKPFILLFIITLLFLILFTGLTWLIDFYYPPKEYTHTVIEGDFPTKTSLLFAGFTDTNVIVHSLAITGIFCACTFKLIRTWLTRSTFWDIIRRSLLLAFLLGSLFFIYKFILLGFNSAVFGFFWKGIRQSLCLVIGLYFIIAALFLTLFSKSRMVSNQHGTQ
ncbi:MAG: hypothetical protein EOO13_14985 [Chitinophagaceae bacterium]|nr:MAG: hypothetical protein EOO13_14985 [Chitinophagaceae bacterium]